MAKIELNHYDLSIKKITRQSDGQVNEIVQINPRLAFDLDFISEMRAQGVRDIVDRDEED